MATSNVILCNPGYGNGPYLRTTELALAVIKQLKKPTTIIMPLLYGQRQKDIITEEYGDIDIVFDETLGAIIQSVYYTNETYEAFLIKWLAHNAKASNDASTYIKEHYPNTILEVARSPLLSFGIHPSCCTLFARTSDILEAAIDEPEISIDSQILLSVGKEFRKLENQFNTRFITQPGTFSCTNPKDESIPLTATLQKDTTKILEPSVYVTTSGIPHVSMITNLNVPLFSNNPDIVPHSKKASPHILSNQNIVLHFARSGWGSIWMSILTETPLLTLPYNPEDDPEILFNNRRIEELGIGIIYTDQSIAELLTQSTNCITKIQELKTQIIKRFGTLNGAEYAAKNIVKSLL